MFINHPHIDRIHLREEIQNDGHIDHTLVVETKLKLPQKSNVCQTSKDFENLIDYLATIAEGKFGDFDKLEIRPSALAYQQNKATPHSTSAK